MYSLNPPARQVWALSKILSNPNLFPIGSLFANMDHLFWRVNLKMEDHQFAWILWYIWKDRNNKVSSNLDIDLRETLRLAKVESTLWTEAHVNNNGCAHEVQVMSSLGTTGRWCFTDAVPALRGSHRSIGFRPSILLTNIGLYFIKPSLV